MIRKHNTLTHNDMMHLNKILYSKTNEPIEYVKYVPENMINNKEENTT